MPDLTTTSDEELARQTQAGSLAAFEELVSRFERRIYAFVANSCRNGTDAREVTQDTFVRGFQAIASYDSRRPFAAWLFTIARRKCIDHHRTKGSSDLQAEPESTDRGDPFELLAQREERQQLWELARRVLPEPQFASLWLRYAEDMEVAQVAQILRKTQTHVKVLLFRARKSLACELNARKAISPSCQASQSAAGMIERNEARNSSTVVSFRGIQGEADGCFVGRKGLS